MIKFKISNPDVSSNERSYITADYSTGTTLYVKNGEGFTANWHVVVGEPGQEQTETALISSATDTTIVISSALKFPHPKSTTVYLSQYNKIAVERKPSGGSYSAITESPFNIGWDNADKKTLIVSSAGESTDTYKWRFYNTTTGNYSNYSDELSASGADRYTLGYVLQQVKRNPAMKNVGDDVLIGYANDYQSLVYEEIPKAWWFTREGDPISTVASTYKYAISSNWSDLLSIKYVLYRYVNGSTDITYALTFSPDQEMYSFKSDANQPDDDYAKWWALFSPDDTSAKGYIALHPTPETADCYIKPVYEIELTDLDSFGDTLVIPNPKGYVDYIMYRVYEDIKSDANNATKYNNRVARSILALRRRAKRQLGQPELFRYRGHRGWSKMFGEQTRLNSSEARENYF